MLWGRMESDPKDDSFAALFESQAKEKGPKRARAVRVGDKIEAKVVQVGKEAVFVELDGKQQAFIEIDEVRGPEGQVEIKAGDTAAARVVEVDLSKGLVRLGTDAR